MRNFLRIASVALLIAACGPKVEVKPIGTRVDPAPPPATPRPAGAEKALPAELPGGWRLSGGPADYTADSAKEALGDEIGRFRGLKSYAAAEYTNLGMRVISVESFMMSTPEAAATALGVGRPADAKPLTGNDLDEAFVAGLRAESRKGALVVRVRWFEAQDEPLADAAQEAMRDALAAGVAAGIATANPAPGSPAASPTPAAPVPGTAAPTPTP